MRSLIREALTQYEQELKEDGSTDAIMFITEEIGNREGMSPQQFNSFCTLANRMSIKIDEKWGF